MVVEQRHPLTVKETRPCLASLRRCMHLKENFQKIVLFNDFPRKKDLKMIFEKTVLEILNEENFSRKDLCRIATTYEIHFTL
jgi:hypothetical protein